MPYVTSRDTRIWWEERGTGEPILLIMGLSFTLDMWHRTAPLLAERYRVILFDNRGVGRSDVPRGPYLIGHMAEDAIKVLDAAGVARAHVIGASMGGMIAQEVALRWPSRVRSLVLACTTCGGLRAKRPDLAELRRRGGWSGRTAEDRVRGFTSLLYASSTPQERIDEDSIIRVRTYPTVRGYLNQLLGLPFWSSYRRLPNIQAPTLIVHGDCDLILPPENAEILASRIPGAKKLILRNAGHLFTTDQPDSAHEALFEFLAESEERGPMLPETALPAAGSILGTA